MTWQPIETAPKDGRSILVANARASWEARWLEGAWYEPNNDPTDAYAWGRPAYDGELLGWMPLPDPPTMDEATSDPARVQSDEPAQVERLRDSNSSSRVRSSSSLRTLIDGFRREVIDKLGVVHHGARDPNRMQRQIVLKQCEDFLVEQFESGLAALLSPVVEGRHDKPEHVCGLSGFCPAPPHWDECPACNSKETK
jgi:hypothetical protein